jgi:hypothetical protein
LEGSVSRLTRIALSIVAKKGEDLLESAMTLVHDHAPDKDIYAIFWNPDTQSIYVSNGDWAEYDTLELQQALENLLGEDHADMEAEIGWPGDDPGWKKVDLDTHKLTER